MREHLAAASLNQLSQVESFCPRIRFKKSTRRGAVWFVEALFPGYLFAKFDYPDCHRAVRSAHGITRIVHFGDEIPTLPAGAIELLRQHHDAGQACITLVPEFEVGETVKITAGSLAGLEAVVTRFIPTRERVQVLLDFLGRQIQAELSLEAVLPSAAARTKLHHPL